MKVFYAYLKYAQNNGVHQQLITFANRETADEWWRMISTPPSPYAGHVKRISPQFYAQSGERYVGTFFNDTRLPDTSRFLEKMFFTHIVNTAYGLRTLESPAAFAPEEITDHISGQWYFIQSKVDPFSHWYLRTNGACVVCEDAHCDAIHVSSEYRTRFCVRVRNDARVSDDFVMIGRDEISIAANKAYILHVDDAGNLKATKGYQGETDLIFSDLKKRFVVRAEKQVNGEVWEYVESVERGVGEIWELVE